MMQVTVQLFAQQAEAIGERSLVLELTDGATVRDAMTQLTKTHPRLSVDASKLAFAVNLSYVGTGHVLSDGDELALVGPVSGG